MKKIILSLLIILLAVPVMAGNNKPGKLIADGIHTNTDINSIKKQLTNLHIEYEDEEYDSNGIHGFRNLYGYETQFLYSLGGWGCDIFGRRYTTDEAHFINVSKSKYLNPSIAECDKIKAVKVFFNEYRKHFKLMMVHITKANIGPEYDRSTLTGDKNTISNYDTDSGEMVPIKIDDEMLVKFDKMCKAVSETEGASLCVTFGYGDNVTNKNDLGYDITGPRHYILFSFDNWGKDFKPATFYITCTDTLLYPIGHRR